MIKLSSSLVQSPAHGCGLRDRITCPCLPVSAHATSSRAVAATCGRPARDLCLRTTTTACHGHLTRPLLHATAASRLWQTHERPPLDAAARAISPAHGLGRRQRG
ncbi:hypothetical protein GW17_00029382 [Ensete ventricosum]|nr:hypothetical protein GW17_00029382 [Ensete ventricosum]RZS28959.1 hypothetical protein BHM03_00062616 [Ensete ventricosum]